MGWGWPWRWHWRILLGSRVSPRDFSMGNVHGGGWKGGRVCTALPACWGGGGAGCRRTTSAPPPELGSASQTASPAPAPRPAGRPYSHTAPFTHWEQSTGQDRAGQGQHQRARRDSTNTKEQTYRETESPKYTDIKDRWALAVCTSGDAHTEAVMKLMFR